MVALVSTVAFQGIEGVPVEVQVMIAPGKMMIQNASPPAIWHIVKTRKQRPILAWPTGCRRLLLIDVPRSSYSGVGLTAGITARLWLPLPNRCPYSLWTE
jgi:hypothetical protein